MDERKTRIIESLKNFAAIQRSMPVYWMALDLLKKGHKKESALLFYPRLFSLAILYHLNNEGTAYSEIKKTVNVSEGSLRLNLKWLEEQGYATVQGTGDESTYRITSAGREAYKLVYDKLVDVFRISGIEAKHISL